MQKAIKAQFEEYKSQESKLELDASQLQVLKETMTDITERSVRKHVTVAYKALSVEKNMMNKMRDDIKADVENFRTQINSGLKFINDSLEANVLHLRKQTDTNLKFFNNTVEATLQHVRKQNDGGLEFINGILEANLQHIREENENLEQRVTLTLSNFNNKLSTMNATIVSNTHNITLNKQSIIINDAKLSNVSEVLVQVNEDISGLNDTLIGLQESLSDTQADIVRKTNDIASNAKRISSNTNSISSLSSRIYTNEKNISPLSGRISANSNDISSNGNSISSLSSRISSNYNSISSISTSRSSFSSFYARLLKKLPNLAQNKKIIFDEVTLNRGYDYSSATGIYTAPVSAYYMFAFYVQSYVGEEAHVGIMWNGLFRGDALAVASKTVHGTGSNTVILYLYKGDKVWVQTMNYSTTLIHHIWPWRTTFSGALLYAD